jgi:hypothetical protein
MAAAAKLCPKRLYLMGSNPHPGAQNFIPHARVREGGRLRAGTCVPNTSMRTAMFEFHTSKDRFPS